MSDPMLISLIALSTLFIGSSAFQPSPLRRTHPPPRRHPQHPQPTQERPRHHVFQPVRFEATREDRAADAVGFVGEDAARFDLEEQSLKSWGIFSVLLVTVLGALYVSWISPETGFGKDYLRLLESTSDSPEVVMTELMGIFAVAHSGLASLRPRMEGIIGARAWRVVFALMSLPLAFSAIAYFINHRYDGVQLWDLRNVPGVHEVVWGLSLVSFFFLYPSTFNLLEVAAVDKPQLHLWESGVMRITRHPQMVGQGLWCLAHTLWIGNSFTLWTSVLLMAHHLFGVWHGDQRLRAKYGEAFDQVQRRTSVVPFAAVIDGRQRLPDDYWKEFVRLPYAVVLAATLGAYWAHPFMQAYSWQSQGRP
ncbi:unnamed protein product [Vitrella brassicaformis CCMP3155]|uniref:NnrU domain-containing protein n=2 Tax=Vitrella brassicaformis TaxID=1169539 RepID=A0A0G4ECX7_VITBC|nr:unnamed protein product [Vitrella brassicaformis CCMP3155]|eukprot:CEL93844.1 unnamed protein product [Vitrella brassicaformis CCMP3155]